MAETSDQPRSLCWLAVGEEGGGLAVSLVNLAGECRRRGHRVTLIAIAEGQLADLARQRGLEVVMLGLPKPRNFAGNLLQKVGRLLESRAYLKRHAGSIAAAVKSVQGETLHVLSPSLLRLACAAAEQANARPVWEMPNTMSSRVPLQLNRRLYRHVIRKHRVLVFANSAYTAATIRGRGVEPIVLYPAVDASRLDPDRVVPALPRDASGVTIGIIARLVPDKGQAQAIEAIAELEDSTRLPDRSLRLILVGGPLDSPFALELRARVESLGLADLVRFVGHVDDPAPWLASIDFAISARTVEEPFGMSIVEAQLMRKPVLVHALGGPAEIVVDGQTGWHLEAGYGPTKEGLIDGIYRALACRDRWPVLGEAGRTRALERFTASILADRYLRHLQIS